jgi:zinc/manganese transport system permease protein
MRALLLEPFWAYGFMRTALVACLGLALANAPVGVLLLQRRMSLTADVLSHAVMPGAALGFLIAGYSVLALSLGGIAAGVLVALLASAATRFEAARSGGERSEAPLAVMYLMSLAAGVLLVSLRGSNIDLMHVLFGTVLAVDARALAFIALVATVTLLSLAAIWRPLAVEGFDPLFLRAMGAGGAVFRGVFLLLVVLCLVAGFQAFGTLLAVGPLLLPAVAARCWTRALQGQVLLAVLFGVLAGIAGLLASFHLNLPSGPAVVLAGGALYGVSLIAAPLGRAARAPALPAEQGMAP